MGYDVFLSYRRADQAIARALVEALEARGVGVWWDQKIEAGTDWRDAIVENLVASDMLVILFSEDCNASKQLKKEMALADDMDKDVIPVLIEDTKPKGHFLYELAARNWIQIFPDAHTKINELADKLTRLAEKSPGGLEGKLPPEIPVAPAPQAAPEAAEAKQQKKQKPKKIKAAKPARQKHYRDFLPFKWVDLLFLIPAMVGVAFMMMDMGSDADAFTEVIIVFAIFSLAVAGLYGGLIFPFRYYFRRRRVGRAALMYLLSSVTMYSSILILFLFGKSMGHFPYDDLDEIAGIFGAVWLIAGGIAFIIYGILNAQRAIRSFNSNVEKI